MQLAEYSRKRDFAKTPEPKPERKTRKRRHGNQDLRFVIQKHDATRLHYDFRLETKNDVLKSWAVPKGISLDPSVKRLAIMTEDHPGDYITFEGKIPEGNYGAGSVIVWDTGKYTSEKDINEQIKDGKLSFTLFGEKVKGAFSLVRTRHDDKQWLLIKSRDRYLSTDDMTETMPQSVLTGKEIEPRKRSKKRSKSTTSLKGTPAEFPTKVKPMLALPVDKPFDNKDWVFEVKWDGVRALLFIEKSKGVLQIRSRKGSDITARYPEIAAQVESAVRCNNSAVVDGEIVILNKDGVPDFQRHQKRMNVDDRRQITFLSNESPATYYVFDILYLDGLSLEGLDFVTRRQILSQTITDGQGRIRISDYIERDGAELFQKAISMKLEGIVAKYKYSKYQQGSRSSAWLKVKGVTTQDCVVIGYTRGEGNREGYFGSLILAAYRDGELQFVGHSGSGFGFDQLGQTLKVMQELTITDSPVDRVPYVNREPTWLKPELVAEVKFHGWTQEGIMRAPIFVRFREDKRSEECIIETPKDTTAIVTSQTIDRKGIIAKSHRSAFTNLEKVFWQASATHGPITKGDLIDYYDSVSSYILTYLLDRPLSLSRYPDGTSGKSFFHKNWYQAKPDYVESIQVFSESSQRIINYLISNNRETLLWLANLGCIEMHPWYSRVQDFTACSDLATSETSNGPPLLESKCGLERPDFIVFDLDPYIYSGRERKDQEPEYTVKGFKATVEVAYELKDLLDSLRIESFVKTSGKTGLHIFIPVEPLYTYDQTRNFAEIIGQILSRKAPNKITMEWNTSRRKDKVFFDHNQNAKGKTIASIFSVRPTQSATVSMPIRWKELEDILPTDFTLSNVPDILKQTGNPWKDILYNRQDLAKLLQGASSA